MSISLYRKYRPRLFREVAGQDTAIGILRSSYAERKLGHAYLFSGPRGCGKTTAARLLAFPDLGPEAVYELKVESFPLLVINDCHGGDLFEITRTSI